MSKELQSTPVAILVAQLVQDIKDISTNMLENSFTRPYNSKMNKVYNMYITWTVVTLYLIKYAKQQQCYCII